MAKAEITFYKEWPPNCGSKFGLNQKVSPYQELDIYTHLGFMAIEVELIGRYAKGKIAIFKLRFGGTEYFINVNQQAKDSLSTFSNVY